MSRIRNMRRGTVIVVGSLIAILMVPTVAWAGTTVYNGIKGTSGYRADVSLSGDVRVAPQPATFESGQVNPGSSWTVLLPTPSNAEVITSINVDTYAVSPSGPDAIQFGLSSNNCATVFTTFEARKSGTFILEKHNLPVISPA